MTHTSHEVAVCGGYGTFTLSEDSHISAQTRTAGRSRNNSAALDKCPEQTHFHSVKVNLLCGRDDDDTHILSAFVTSHDISGSNKVFKAAVSA